MDTWNCLPEEMLPYVLPYFGVFATSDFSVSFMDYRPSAVLGWTGLSLRLPLCLGIYLSFSFCMFIFARFKQSFMCLMCSVRQCSHPRSTVMCSWAKNLLYYKHPVCWCAVLIKEETIFSQLRPPFSDSFSHRFEGPFVLVLFHCCFIVNTSSLCT